MIDGEEQDGGDLHLLPGYRPPLEWSYLSEPTKRCAYCRGSGLQQRGTTLTCGVCGGVGWVRVPEDAVPCPPCGGMGVEPAMLGESQLPCLTCGGKGVISAERAKKLPPAKRRPRRRGRGYGSGKVTLEY